MRAKPEWSFKPPKTKGRTKAGIVKQVQNERKEKNQSKKI